MSESDPVIPKDKINHSLWAYHPLTPNRLAYSSYRLQGKDKRSETWMIFSENDGLTDQKSRFGARDSNESTLCKLKSGRIIAAAEPIQIIMSSFVNFQSLETDGGRGQLTLPMQHPADLTVLSDKCVLLTYGIRNQG